MNISLDILYNMTNDHTMLKLVFYNYFINLLIYNAQEINTIPI